MNRETLLLDTNKVNIHDVKSKSDLIGLNNMFWMSQKRYRYSSGQELVAS
jgi:hypothetical protein